jgi:NAD(P)-dependent dehydrogenase (short-subunit alcohol dehydrogenase family)
MSLVLFSHPALCRSPADLSKAGDVERLYSTLRREYGRLDLLFNNAGAAMPPTPVHLTTYAEWRRVVGINLDAAFLVAKEAFVRPSAQPKNKRRPLCVRQPSPQKNTSFPRCYAVCRGANALAGAPGRFTDPILPSR